MVEYMISGEFKNQRSDSLQIRKVKEFSKKFRFIHIVQVMVTLNNYNLFIYAIS